MKEIKSLEGYSLSSFNLTLFKKRQTRLNLYLKLVIIVGAGLLLSIFFLDFLFLPTVIVIFIFLFLFRFLMPDKRRYKCEECQSIMKKYIYSTHGGRADEVVIACCSCKLFFKTGVYYD